MTDGENVTSGRVIEEAQAAGFREETTDFARRIIRLHRNLPEEVVAQALRG